MYKYLLVFITLFNFGKTYSSGCNFTGTVDGLVAIFGGNLDISINPLPPFSVGDQVMITVDTLPGFFAAIDLNTTANTRDCICQEQDGTDFTSILVNGEVIDSVINLSGNGGSTINFPFTFPFTFPSEGTYTVELKCAANVAFSVMGKITSKDSFQKAFLNTNIPLGAFTVSAAIPTLSQWGLIILGVCLLIFGVTALREQMAVTRISSDDIDSKE